MAHIIHIYIYNVAKPISESSIVHITFLKSLLYVHVFFIFFPTCQVRAVRFYHSCSPPPAPPPPHPPPPSPPPPSPPASPAPPLHPLPCPLPPCQLFANFRTQWALLDLNCKSLSALGTAGPQPGTFRAQ